MSTTAVPLTAQQRLVAELTDELAVLEAHGLLRRLRCVEAWDGPVVRVDGREAVTWCSNDYLGLAAHPALREAAGNAAAEWGVGARASRLLAGTTRWHTRLEDALAAWCGTEAAAVYPSGYLANLGTLGALLAPRDLVVVDRLAHASLFDAVRASCATLRVFQHNDAAHAAELLSRAGPVRRRLLVTEGVFSMDGDAAPLADLLVVAEAHGALVYLDDAHGAFVLGATGRGAPEAAGIATERFLYMGALGKALGCQGGFVAGPRPLIELLHNRARTFIYTTALAVPVAAAATEALALLDREAARRRILRERAERLHHRLTAAGLVDRHRLPSHIVPVILGETNRTIAVAQALWERGMLAPAIRPPTVPEGTARLRLSVTALHTEAHIDALATALKDALDGVRSSEFGVRNTDGVTPHSALRTPHSGS